MLLEGKNAIVYGAGGSVARLPVLSPEGERGSSSPVAPARSWMRWPRTSGPQGVRVVGIWTAGLPETLSPEKLAPYVGGQEMDEAAYRCLIENPDGMRTTRRSPLLAAVADTAAFLASEQGVCVALARVESSIMSSADVCHIELTTTIITERPGSALGSSVRRESDQKMERKPVEAGDGARPPPRRVRSEEQSNGTRLGSA